MATRLSKPVVREVALRNGERVVMSVTPAGIFMRMVGRRTTYGPLSTDFVWLTCAKIRAAENMREREQRKQLRRLAS